MKRPAPFKINIGITPRGEIDPSIQADQGNRIPLEAYELYHKLEPEILRFKKSIHKAISAYYQPETNITRRGNE